MARMYPDHFPPEMEADPRRQAEATVYAELQRQLDDSHSVFYSVAWLAKKPSGGARDGETDFVIAHPEAGLLMLEVKGGRIARSDGGAWTSTDRAGVVHAIHDPAEQARSGKYQLVKKLQSLPDWGFAPFDAGHAVVFPDCARLAQLGPDLPREIVLFGEDIAALGKSIAAVFAFWRRKGATSLDADRMRLLKAFLAPEFVLTPSLAAQVRASERQIFQLGRNQIAILDFLARKRRAAVTGVPGSGKTLLALEKARRLAGQGLRTLLTCFNRPLAEHLRREAPDVPNLTIRTYHHLCKDFAEQAGVPLVEPAEGADDAARRAFYDAHPDALIAALDRRPELRFDAIVVDEGQDFDGRWWDSVQLALEDPAEGILQVFHDDHQAIYGHRAGFPRLDHAGHLGHNWRNTGPICRAVATHYGLEMTALGPDGPAPEWHEAEDEAAVHRTVKKLLHRLIAVDGIAPGDVAVLSGRALNRSALGKEGVIGAHPVSRNPADANKVVLSTVHSFKGLDRPVVVLAELEHSLERGYAEVPYVGMTRARSLLAVVGTKAALETLRQPRVAATSI